MRKTRGGSKLRQWAKKALNLARVHGPGFAKKYKLGSRALSGIAAQYPHYAPYMKHFQEVVKQTGYGHGGALRSSGGARRPRRRNLRYR